MSIAVLIVTPEAGFGEFVETALADAGGYRTALAKDAWTAIQRASKFPFNMTIIDGVLPPQAQSAVVHALHSHRPDAKVLVIRPAGASDWKPPKGIQVDAWIDKPFYLPDFLETVQQTAGAGAHPEQKLEGGRAIPQAEPSESPAILWLEDVARATQHLKRLVFESAVQAALVLRQGKLWAYAGHLSQSAAQELVRRVFGDPELSAAADSKEDLARFVRLETTGRDYMLYATGLGDGMVLALAFESEMPFSKMRAQAGRLARSLTTPPGAEQPGPSRPKVEPSPHPAYAPRGAEPQVAEEYDAEEDEDDLEALEDLDLPKGPLFSLDQVPEPTPGRPVLPRQAPEKEETGRAEQKPAGAEPGPPQEGEHAKIAGFDQAADESAAGNESADSPLEMDPARYNLTYACALAPRIPGQYLTGELARRLAEWARQTCLAFGWRLERLLVRPDHLIWVCRLCPETPPALMIKEMRSRISERIFLDFPQYAEENPSADFWAPGYLILTSSQPPPAPVLKEFLELTRQWQGVAEEA